MKIYKKLRNLRFFENNMNDIIIKFLGTGNAVPTELRNHTSILLSWGSENILFDCGEGTQRQFKIARISPHKLNRIFITHWHGDHILGLPGLLQTLAMTEYKKTLHIYGPRGTRNHMSEISNLIKEVKIPLEIHEIESGKIIETKDFIIEGLPVNHGTPSLAYSFAIKKQRRLDKKKIKKFKLPNSPILGKLQSGQDITFNGKKISSKQVSYIEEGRKVSIILDTAPCENAVKIAGNSNLAIIESSFSNEDVARARERMHLTAGDAANIAKKAKAKKLILTHISERYEHNLKIMEKEARKTFKNTSTAKDFDVVKV